MDVLKKIAGVLLPVLATAMVSAPVVSAEPSAQPNVVIIMADDMRADDLAKMRQTRALLGQLRLKNFISSHPLCCPARAQLLTGQNAERSGVFHNRGPYGAYHSLTDKGNTLATWFDDAGYHTGFVGKFLNGWTANRWPAAPGWDDFNVWHGGAYTAHDWVDWNDGRPRAPGTHTNDGVTDVVREQIRKYAGDNPFLIFAAYVAPHAMKDPVTEKFLPDGPVPAPRHRNTPVGAPSYQDKPSFTYTGAKARRYAQKWRARIRSLLSIDEGVAEIVADLKARGEWKNTVMVFMSDNGLMLGEHQLKGKNLPYEEVLRTPFLATGPGVASGTSDKAAMTIDIGPSLAALAGVPVPERRAPDGNLYPVEGRSDLFSLEGGWGDRALIQAGTNHDGRHFGWRGMRTSKWTYVHWFEGREELYNRRQDPYQLRNLAGLRPRVQARLAAATPNPY